MYIVNSILFLFRQYAYYTHFNVLKFLGSWVGIRTYQSEDSVEEGRCWEKEQKDCEEESSQEQLVHMESTGIHALTENIPLLASKQTPEGHQTMYL